jgi:hypothetical protein
MSRQPPPAGHVVAEQRHVVADPNLVCSHSGNESYGRRFHRVNTFFNEESQAHPGAAIVGGPLPSAPKLKAPNFGKWLIARRGERSHEQIAAKVRKYVEGFGLSVHRSSIVKYEQGRVPSWPVLYAFARIYDEQPSDIAARLFSAIQIQDGHDLVRHSLDQPSGSPEGGSADVVPASSRDRDRISELERQLDEYKTLVDPLQDVAFRLVQIARDSRKIGAASSRRSRGGGRHRKTG